jgi:hypothetical protein
MSWAIRLCGRSEREVYQGHIVSRVKVIVES